LTTEAKANTLTPLQRARRDRILKTTRNQLSKKGYEGINMRSLATAARVSPTTLYNLYENKDVLVLSALQDQLVDLARQTNVRPEQGFDFLLEMTRAVIREIAETPRWASAMAQLLFQSDPDDPIANTLLVDRVEPLVQALTTMRDVRELREDVDPRKLAHALIASSWSAILLWVKGLFTLQDLQEEYVNNALYLLYAFATPKLKRKLDAELGEHQSASAARVRRSSHR
jgi:AcrR family transcriptional regulator|tara:strand:+ start:1038 stop:1724 length:687 start_codon:yes stop_codon:yes gene_type:complete